MLSLRRTLESLQVYLALNLLAKYSRLGRRKVAATGTLDYETRTRSGSASHPSTSAWTDPVSLRVAAYAVCIEDDRVLLARHVSGNWTLPGGGVEHGED